MTRRVSWQEQLRRTTAKTSLEATNYDLFPTEQVRAITDNLLQSPPLFGLFRRYEAQTEDCDVFLIGQLAPLRGRLNVEETGIIACLRALTHQTAYGMLIKLREQSEEEDVFFLSRIRAYLQCLLLAYKERPDIFFSDPSSDAQQLLEVAKETSLDVFPTMIQVLEGIGNEEYPDFLSTTMIRKLLRWKDYKGNLKNELRRLSRTCDWVSVHRLVGGLRRLSELPGVGRIIHEAFPDVPKWAAWTPNVNRIHLWQSAILIPFKDVLAPIFVLEGPDTTGNQRQTLRQSRPGKFAHALRLPEKRGLHILDALLNIFDRAITIGEEAIQLLITLCIKPDQISWTAVEQVRMALDLCSPFQLRTLTDYMRSSQNTDGVFDRMQRTTAVLQVIQSHPNLQTAFGNFGNLAHRGPEILGKAQLQLCKQVKSKRVSESLALHVSALGQALRSASWLHDGWHDYVIEDLRRIPSKENVSMLIRLMKDTPSELYPAFRNIIVVRLCSMKHKDPTTIPSVEEAIILGIMDDPLCSTALDPERHHLRDLLLQEAMRGFDLQHATLCIKQSISEHAIFVRDLRQIMAAKESDLACIKLASYLGPLCIPKGRIETTLATCWKKLLMHMMRRRNPGLLERYRYSLASETWLDFQHNLQLLFVDKHFDPEGGLGFTQKLFASITREKIGIGRRISTNTSSTGGTTR